MGKAALCHGRAGEPGKICKACSRVGDAKKRCVFEGLRQRVEPVTGRIAPDGGELLLSRRDGFIGIGAVTVDLAGDGIAHFLIHLGRQNPHGGDGGADDGEKIGNGITLLEV